MSTPNYFFHKLVQSLAQGKDIIFLTRQLAQTLNRPVLITNAVHRILAFQDPLSLNIQIGEFFPVPPVKINEEEFFESYCNLLIENEYKTEDQSSTYTYLPLQSAGHCLGYCIILNAGTNPEKSPSILLTADDKLYITQASLVILLALRSAWEFQAGLQQSQDEFIRDILYNNYDSKLSIFEKAHLWHWNLQGPLIIAALECADEDLTKARDLIPQLFNRQIPISACINNQLILILRVKDLEKTRQKTALQKFLTEFLNHLSDYGVSQVWTGVSSRAAAVTDLYKSYQEAKVALELGKVFNCGPVCYFEEIGFLKFIFTQPALELQEFSQRILGPLLDYDLESEADLLQTLRIYIDCKCQIAESAKVLYIHENTLRNRVKKIEQLTGYDLHCIDHMVNVYIALQILNLGEYN